MENRNGFTLIELMVTVAVVAIIATVGIPNMMEMVRNERLVSTTNQFISVLNYARSEAIKRNATIDITSAAAGGDWGSGVSVTLDNAGKTLLRKMDSIPSSFTLTSANSYTQLQYKANGFINNTDTLNLCSTAAGKPGRQIQISVTGRVSVQTIAATSNTCP